MGEDAVPLRPRPRPPLRYALAVLVVAGVAPLAVGAAPAAAASILSVNPTSIRPGSAVEIRATCGGNANPAFVHSGAFGSVTLVPSRGVLRTDVAIPPDTLAGVYTVFLECASGQRDSTQLTVLGPSRQPNPQVGPQTGGGGMAGGDAMRTFYGGLAAMLTGGAIWIMAGLLVRRRSRA